MYTTLHYIEETACIYRLVYFYILILYEQLEIHHAHNTAGTNYSSWVTDRYICLGSNSNDHRMGVDILDRQEKRTDGYFFKNYVKKHSHACIPHPFLYSCYTNIGGMLVYNKNEYILAMSLTTQSKTSTCYVYHSVHVCTIHNNIAT